MTSFRVRPLYTLFFLSLYYSTIKAGSILKTYFTFYINMFACAALENMVGVKYNVKENKKICQIK